MLPTDIILYVEDDIAYAEHLICLMKQVGTKHQLIHLSHGDEAIEYLSRKGKYSDTTLYPSPGIMLVDLKMPRVNGFELLKWVRTKSKFAHIPFVVLTVSEELKDVEKAYELGANSFLIKPPRAEDLRNMIKAWEDYWFKHNITRQKLSGE